MGNHIAELIANNFTPEEAEEAFSAIKANQTVRIEIDSLWVSVWVNQKTVIYRPTYWGILTQRLVMSEYAAQPPNK